MGEKISSSLQGTSAADPSIGGLLPAGLRSSEDSTAGNLPYNLSPRVSPGFAVGQPTGARNIRPIYPDVIRHPVSGGGRGFFRKGKEALKRILVRWTNFIGLTFICLAGIIIVGIAHMV